MATRLDILRTLNKLQIENFKKIIELANVHIVQRRVQFERLQSFITDRANRLDSIVDAVADKQAADAVLDEYTTFQNTCQTIGNQSDDLDEISGTLHYTLYGDVKKTKLRQRELSELIFFKDKIGIYIDDLEELESDLATLTSDLNSAASS